MKWAQTRRFSHGFRWWLDGCKFITGDAHGSLVCNWMAIDVRYISSGHVLM